MEQQDLPGAGELLEGNQGRDKKKGPGTGAPEGKKGSKVHRLSQGKDPYTPKKPERVKPALLTVDQYLRKTAQDKGISDLVRSLHRTKVMTFQEWEREVAALLKKQTW